MPRRRDKRRIGLVFVYLLLSAVSSSAAGIHAPGLHRDIERGVFCRASAIEPVAPSRRRSLPMPEEQANAFAAALLMAARLIHEQYTRSDRDLPSLCKMFDASSAAMERRLQDIVEPA